jgi:hypothetical protein
VTQKIQSDGRAKLEQAIHTEARMCSMRSSTLVLRVYG